MSKTPYMQFYINDYLGDTQHLTTVQHGAYLLLLFSLWSKGGKIKNNDKQIAYITRLSLKKWLAIKEDIMCFFEHDGEYFFNKRLIESFQKVDTLSQKRSAAGAKGFLAKSLKNNNSTQANAIANDEQNSSISYSYSKDTSKEVSIRQKHDEKEPVKKFSENSLKVRQELILRAEEYSKFYNDLHKIDIWLDKKYSVDDCLEAIKFSYDLKKGEFVSLNYIEKVLFNKFTPKTENSNLAEGELRLKLYREALLKNKDAPWCFGSNNHPSTEYALNFYGKELILKYGFKPFAKD